MSRIVAGRFHLAERIGAGAVADVFAARDAATGIEVAVKLASDRIAPAEARLRFEREAAALSVLASPHVVELLAAGETEEGRAYLVLERLRGRTLEQRLRSEGPIPPPHLLRWFGHAAAAVDLAHGVGIVHRDLKPANLFLHTTDEGRGGDATTRLKVLDFGMLTDVQDSGTREPGMVVGTPLYMAPEQARGQSLRVGPATDVWALAMVAVTLLTGEDYWGTTAIHELIAAIDGAPLYPPSSRWPWLPPSFDAWFSRSTQRVPERRFRSVRQQTAALAESLPIGEVPAAQRPATLDSASTVQAPTPPPGSSTVAEPAGPPLFGRRVELTALLEQLVEGSVITLTGPGGVGKSRIAAAAAKALGERLRDGAWVVPLGALVDPDGVADAIAEGLGLEADTVQPAIDRVAGALSPRRALVVLDGLEHLLAARARIATLIEQAPRVSWLLTSRVPLGLPGEQTVLVEPLEVPPPSVSPLEAERYPAVDLFVTRVREARPDFLLTPDNTPAVVALCRRAEGIPLALELAAAQVRSRPLEEIGTHLDRADEHAGVPGAVAWSYALLDERDRAVLRHLALFPAGETLAEARERLSPIAGGQGVLPSLDRLVKSHLLVIAEGEAPRYTMLEAVRDFCAAASDAAGETRRLWDDALAHLERLAEQADEGLRGRDQGDWLSILDGAHDNFRAALAWAELHEPGAALRLAGRLAWYWYLRGTYHEGSRWLEGSLERAPTVEGTVRLGALTGAGRLAFLSCRYVRGEELLLEASRLAGQVGDRRAEADVEQILASIARERGQYGAARGRLLRCFTLWRILEDRREVARTRSYLAFVAWIGGDEESAEAAGEGWLADAEAEFDALGDREGLVWSLLNRGATAHYAGDEETARETLARAFAESVALRFQEGIAWALNLAGLVSLRLGERVQARARLRASLRVHRRLGDLWRCASVLEALAVLASDSGEAAQAALLFGGAAAIRQRIGAPIPRREQPLHEGAIEQVRATLGEGAAAALERGAALPLDELVTAATGVRITP